ncbi:FAD dependent oxidoreductase [Arachidicoccus rhizosphaerae]|uniref:FAD dependent oxidoreductase n=1 Tax=Arachidicoccus rhizosphaerae TaxID=551991 RepID=A0A1H4AJW5_9BACT|nr:FAD dependent oxidoreductase [Arachidicoccus rhizosphaerae]
MPVDWLSSAEILERYRITNTHGGILSHQGGSIDAFRFTHDVLAYNNSRGLAIYDKTEIIKVKYGERGIRAWTSYGNIINAKKIIYCNGYESVNIIKDKFVKLLSTYAIVGERFDGDQSEIQELLVWNTANPYIYLRTTDDNRILIGGGDEPFLDTARRDSLLNQKRIFLEKKLLKLLPAEDPRRTFRTDFAWAGTFGETKDGLPYIGKHPNFPGAYFVLGFGGNGITFSITGMEMVSYMLQGKKHPLEPYYKFRR